MVSTLLMGVLALIAALHFGRSILLPVVAALIVGITLAPAVKFGSRFSIPQPVSALGVVVLVAVLVGLVLTFFAAPLSEWIARAPEIGKVVQETLRVTKKMIIFCRSVELVARKNTSVPKNRTNWLTAGVIATSAVPTISAGVDSTATVGPCDAAGITALRISRTTERG